MVGVVCLFRSCNCVSVLSLAKIAIWSPATHFDHSTSGSDACLCRNGRRFN